MSRSKAIAWQRLSRAALVIAVILIFAGLSLAVWTLPPGITGLAAQANAELAATGVSNPVTATLLNFRSYDTLLEVAVILLAVTAIRALRSADAPRMRPGGDVLTFLSRIQAPAMIMIAGYLLWSGSHAPGGAFQAGAVLAAAGVLLILAGRRLSLRFDGVAMRLGLTIGLAVFVAVAVAGISIGNTFLGYSQHNAANVVLLLEVSVAVSIALALLDMFLGVLASSPGPARDKEES